MSEEILKSIDSKLDVVIKLLAVNAIKGKSDAEQIEFLHNLKMTSPEIGQLIGRSDSNVRLYLTKKKSTNGAKRNER
jgi:hypothetical protein